LAGACADEAAAMAENNISIEKNLAALPAMATENFFC
jgi:hypothetical protein